MSTQCTATVFKNANSVFGIISKGTEIRTVVIICTILIHLFSEALFGVW